VPSRWRGTSANQKAYRSLRSPRVSVAHRRRSRRTSVKARYVGVCRGCGAYTQPRNGKGDAYPYCKACHPGAIERCWTRERLLDAMLRWSTRNGRLPTSYDWSRTHARRRGGKPLERLSTGDWPSAGVVPPSMGAGRRHGLRPRSSSSRLAMAVDGRGSVVPDDTWPAGRDVIADRPARTRRTVQKAADADRDSGPETLYLEGSPFPAAIKTERSVVTTQISELGRAPRRLPAAAAGLGPRGRRDGGAGSEDRAYAAGGVRPARLQRGVPRGARPPTPPGCAIGCQAGAERRRRDSNPRHADYDYDLAKSGCLRKPNLFGLFRS
jgi:hypothetical protein